MIPCVVLAAPRTIPGFGQDRSTDAYDVHVVPHLKTLHLEAVSLAEHLESLDEAFGILDATRWNMSFYDVHWVGLSWGICSERKAKQCRRKQETGGDEVLNERQDRCGRGEWEMDSSRTPTRLAPSLS